MAREAPRDWLGYFFPMMLSVGTLVLLGIGSIHAWAGAREDEARKQMVFLCFAVAAFLAVQLVNYRKLLRYSLLFYLLTLLPLAYTVASRAHDRVYGLPFAKPVKGACAWIQLGPISIQPSEFAKIALVMFLAWILRQEEQQRQRSGRMILQVLGFSFLSLVLVLQQPDLGMVLTMLTPVLALLFVSGIRKRYLAGLFLSGLLALPVLWLSGTCDLMGSACPDCPNVPVLRHLPQVVKHYQRSRVYSLFSADPRIQQEGGYQQERALEAIGSGGLRGKGQGDISVSRHVPEAQNDMVLALIGEQYGLLGIAVVLLSYTLLFGAGIAIAMVHREPAGKLLAVGLVVLMAGQTLFNLGVILRLLPVTGLTLPFVSYGGSSLVANFMVVGLLVNIARNQKKAMF